MTSLKKKLFKYVNEEYQTDPEYPWKKTPNFAVLRHKSNKKWYGVVMNIPKNKFGIESDELIDVINLKSDFLLSGFSLAIDGVFPAYHMNKANWISVFLDGTVCFEDIKELVDISYALTLDRIKEKT